MDETPIPLKRFLDSDLPSDGAVLRAIEKTLRGDARMGDDRTDPSDPTDPSDAPCPLNPAYRFPLPLTLSGV